ncbi:MoaD/ThiS family protein [Lactobacillus helveticus]|nr:MoaD/ThiS family protein [Lactobacillus helveticus]NRO68089.1 hypothetical protein [Lactobacillus helveticus]NRO69964.1 hypothetical protein [Lactobacillus helveticus]
MMVTVQLRGIAEGRLGVNHIAYDLRLGSKVKDMIKKVVSLDEDLKHNIFNTTLNEPRKLCRVLVNGELAQFNQTLKTTDSVALVGVVTCDG